MLFRSRKASGKYEKTYTDILAAGTGGKNVAFQGVWKRPGGPSGFRKIQTLDDAAKWSGQSKQTLLKIISDIQNPSLQAKAATFVGGATEFRGSPPNIGIRYPGTSWRGGRGDNQFLTSQAAGYDYTYIRPEGAAPFNLPAPVAKPKPTTPGKVPTSVIDEVNITKGGTATVGRTTGYLGRGGEHKGIDIGTSHQKGYYVSFGQSGKVVYAGWNNYGYGYLVIIRSGNLEFFFAHLAKILVKNGSPYNGETIGEIGNTGHSHGEHLHFEVGVVGGGSINPEPYLGLLSIGRQFTTDISGKKSKPVQPLTALKPSDSTSVKVNDEEIQIDSASLTSFNKLLQGLTTEQKGRKVVVIDDRKLTPPMIFSAAGDDIISSGVDEFTLVNNFMKNKLLLDLTYL